MEQKKLNASRAIAVATATRAKPILLTVLAIVFASSLLAGDAVFGGLGVSLIFGTVAAVVASLIIVPVLMYKADLVMFDSISTGFAEAVTIEAPTLIYSNEFDYNLASKFGKKINVNQNGNTPKLSQR